MELNNTIEATGSFEATNELTIFAEGQGRIKELYIKEGQNIRKGSAVAKLDDASIQAQLRIAKASLAKADNDVASYKRLLEAGAISAAQFRDIELAKISAETNITTIEQQLNYTTAYAPISGVVKELKVEKGSFAGPGSQLAVVVDISRLNMIIKVAEADVVKVKKGQRVEIIADVYPAHTFVGTVGNIGIQADAGRKYEVEVDIANSGQFPLKPGMFGAANIKTKSQTEYGLFVPRKAIIGSVKNAQIYVADGDKAILKSIEVGQIVGDKVQILSGLEADEVIITSGQMNLKDGKNIIIK
ncbi:MAG: efflux RND transporter periplasmic adaptor subunit [Saprospiraceae bacterium]|nr:efflux RND transporter periplasmic adaptor subunit [Saprospiraceae bacterium]